MAGQGRNADGLTGSQSSDAPNVVRFPGDWFGPLGELVPIGTDADTTQDEQDLYVEAPEGVGADSFWGEDAQDVHRVATPTRASRPGRRSLRLCLVLAIGGVAIAAVVLTAVLGSGTQMPGSGHVLPNRQTRSTAIAQLSTAQVKVAGHRAKAARPADNHRGRADRAAPVRHAAQQRLLVPEAARPDTSVAVTNVEADAAVSADTKEVATPSGLVSPPPNAARLNP
jgi:hypothetical protein